MERHALGRLGHADSISRSGRKRLTLTLLNGVQSPDDVKRLTRAEKQQLAAEIREFLVQNVSRTGGHLGPNLGVVELSIAVHAVFDSPRDSIIFDTGHQSYVHKILTGRHNFQTLRSRGGLAGYPQRSESEHDIVESSHASSALSWADGISRARVLAGESERFTVAVVGDGALTGGMTWEALNNISADNDRRLVVIVNDNGRSYAPTIGGIARFLDSVRTKPSYRGLRHSSERVFGIFGTPGRAFYRGVRGGTRGFLSRFTNNEQLYSNLDIKYVGPVDGHDVEALELALLRAKDYGAPVIVHVITEKGRGYEPARLNTDDQFHAIGKFDASTGEVEDAGTTETWTDVFGRELVKLGEANPSILAITAAMLKPTGLDAFAERFPDRVIDVGIAEQHAVTSAAGLAFAGMHPVVAIYATFMNRALDQVIMDVALHSAGVTFVLDRAGITGPDGASHNGVWDLAMLQIVPGIRIAAPRDAETLAEELAEAVAVSDAPTVVRFPKGAVAKKIPAKKRFADGVDVLLGGSNADVLFVAVGAMSETALGAAELLEREGVTCTVIDPRWVIPVPKSVIRLAAKHRLLVSLEDGLRTGGVGTRIRQDLRAAGVDTAVTELGIRDEFLGHASRNELLADNGLTPTAVAEDVLAQLRGEKLPHAKPKQA